MRTGLAPLSGRRPSLKNDVLQPPALRHDLVEPRRLAAYRLRRFVGDAEANISGQGDGFVHVGAR